MFPKIGYLLNLFIFSSNAVVQLLKQKLGMVKQHKNTVKPPSTSWENLSVYTSFKLTSVRTSIIRPHPSLNPAEHTCALADSRHDTRSIYMDLDWAFGFPRTLWAVPWRITYPRN